MSTHDDLLIYRNAVVILAAAGIVIPLLSRLKISPVLGWLAAGAILGGFTQISIPHALAEMGIVFLMFLIGIELSFERLVMLKKYVFGLGSSQILATAFIIAIVMYYFQFNTIAITLIAFSFALSSTAIVVDLLAAQNKMITMTGRVSFSVLLMQDLAVIPLLFLVSVLGGTGEEALIKSLSLALVNAVIMMIFIVIVGRLLLRPLFRMVLGAEGQEFFMAAMLLVIVGAGYLASLAGLSMALGGFIAGLLIAETEYRKSIESTIEPFKGLLLGLFFITVGMKLNPQLLITTPLYYFGFALTLILLKAMIFYGIARAFKVSKSAAIESALLLGAGGEFAFITLQTGLLEEKLSQDLFIIIALSMAFAPLAGYLGAYFAKRLRPKISHSDLEPHNEDESQALIVGSGRVGILVSDMLNKHNLKHLLTDSDPKAVTRARAEGRKAYHGNATALSFLKSCGLDKATALIVTIHTHRTIDEIVTLVRREYPQLPIIARSRDLAHAEHLYEIGVNIAVPETYEASLQLSESSLVELGIPMGKVIASIHEKRDEYRAILKKKQI